MDPTSKSRTPAPKWIGGREASRLLDASQTVVQRAALFGLIKVELVPGLPPQYERKSGQNSPAQKRTPPVSHQRGCPGFVSVN